MFACDVLLAVNTYTAYLYYYKVVWFSEDNQGTTKDNDINSRASH